MTDAGQRTNAWAAFGRPAPGPGPSLVAPAKGTAPCRHCGDTVLPAPCPVLRSHVSSDRNKQVSGKQGRDARCSRTHGTSGKRADRCHSGRNGRLSPSCSVPRKGARPHGFRAAPADSRPSRRPLPRAPPALRPQGPHGGPQHCHPGSPSLRLTVSIFTAWASRPA